MNYYAVTYSNQLKHYGVKGQTWGVRKYQYEDGTYTPAGKERYFGNNSKSSASNSSGGKNTAPSSNQRTVTTPTTNRTTGTNSGTKTHGVNYSYYNSDATSRLYNSKSKFNETPDKNANNKKVVKNNLVGSGTSGKSGKSGSGKSKKSEEEKAAEKAAKEAERERKKAEREAEREAKKKASAASKAAKDKEKEEKQKAKADAEAKAKAEAEAKAKEAEKKKPVDPIDEDETLSEREKRMYKGIRNILEKTGQSMETYYKNEGFDAIFNRYFPGDLDEDEKKVIKKKFMNYYKLEHGEASIGEYYAVTYSNSLSHHGIKGQKWGIRRYQNEDGSLTDAGRSRYGVVGLVKNRLDAGKKYRLAKKEAKAARKARDNKAFKEVENAERRIEKGYKRGQNLSDKDLEREERAYKKYNSSISKSKDQYKSDIAKAKSERKEATKLTAEQKAKLKKGLLIGAAVVGTTAAAYLGYKYVKNQKALTTLMRSANSDISLGKSMVEKMRHDMLDDMAKARSSGIDHGTNPVLSKTITYLGNDLNNHTASYNVYARNVPGVRGDTFAVGKTFENKGADTQKVFENLREYKRARKRAGYKNWVV